MGFTGMKWIAASIAALCLCACSQQPAGEQLAVAEDDVPAIDPLLPPGEYRLAGADGEEVNLGHAITVSITAGEISISSQCVSPRWSYRREEGKLLTQPIPQAICERALYPAEEAAFAAFGDPQTILRTPTNGWFVEGGGHSITLYSQ